MSADEKFHPELLAYDFCFLHKDARRVPRTTQVAVAAKFLLFGTEFATTVVLGLILFYSGGEELGHGKQRRGRKRRRPKALWSAESGSASDSIDRIVAGAHRGFHEFCCRGRVEVGDRWAPKCSVRIGSQRGHETWRMTRGSQLTAIRSNMVKLGS